MISEKSDKSDGMSEGFLTPDRPKRLLSIDGGGIRGIIAAEILLELENTLKQVNPKWRRLSDYFDFISGTSTGSIIAAGLAKGMGVQEILDIYENEGVEIFTKWWNPIQRFWSQYNPKPLERKLQDVFGNMTLEGSNWKTRLMIVTKNATKGETWCFVNDPKNKYYLNNKHIPVWQLIRASSAAPTFFPPFKISIDKDPKNTYEFIDGGMSMFNNSSYQLFLEATQSLSWQTGIDEMLLVSIGTGFTPETIKANQAQNYSLINWAGYAVGTLMEDANVQQNILMQQIGYEIKKIKENETIQESSSKKLSYIRYTTSLEGYRLKQLNKRLSELGEEIINADSKDVRPMDCVDQIQELKKIGKAVAIEQVKKEHFNDFLH